ncbi:MAG TPA: VWA domain-containing protein [Polyangiaceae bacterium]|nr:VWA domain-containing protein [Polyangiaceae bacterium]
MRAALRELEQRIERVSKSEDVSMLYRIAAPVFGALGWKARLSSDAAVRLVAAFAERDDRTLAEARARLAPLLDAAVRELADNTTNVERLAAVRRRQPVAHAAWLRRSFELLVRADGALEPVDEEERHDLSDSVAVAQRLALQPPLARAIPDEAKAADPEAAAEVRKAERVVDLELAAVDHLLTAARLETEVLSRRRRLFEAARQVLLDASAALELDKEGVSLRTRAITAEITRLDRLEAAGVDFDVGLPHQARTAVTRGEEARLRAVIAAIDHVARSSGDTSMRRLSRRGVHALFGDVRALDDEARRESLARSAEESLGADVCARVKGAYASALAAKQRDARAHAQELGYLGGSAHEQTLAATLAVDGAFDLGGTLSPVRVTRERRTTRRVPFPAPALALVAAESVEDLPDALIEDPRLLVLQLATGRLLARRYVLEEVHRSTQIVMTSEVRVFLLDGSGSMLGPRARVRDAMLVAELATMRRRLEHARDVRTALFYGYFTDEVGAISRVDSAKGVDQAITEVISTVRVGGTDIQRALVAAFELVATARGDDKELARAQVVLVTDGEADVEEAAVLAAREGAGGDLPIGVSVIALGTENPALRGLVARQRARGERAFYHFVDDALLADMAAGALDAGLPLHAAAKAPWSARGAAPTLEARVGALVAELEDLARERDLDALERMDHEREALREVGLEAHTSLTEGERARIESLQRDSAALGRRFARWFPLAPDADDEASQLSVVGAQGSSDAEAVHVMLASIVEITRVVGGSELARRADAIDLVERLLPDAGLTPARYFATLSAHGRRLAPALEALHQAVRGPGAGPPSGRPRDGARSPS